MVKHRNYVDLEKEFSALDGWLKRVYERPAFKRSLEKGNGYDFSKLPSPRKL
jgi:glutathione S-transferase